MGVHRETAESFIIIILTIWVGRNLGFSTSLSNTRLISAASAESGLMNSTARSALLVRFAVFRANAIR